MACKFLQIFPSQSTRAPTDMLFSPCLPAELWIQIFRFATLSHRLEPSRDYEYSPFSWCQENENGQWATTLPVKLSLVQVCRNWRELATELLYEEIGFLWNYSSVKGALEGKGSSESEGCGRFVRRLMEIPWLHPVTLGIVNSCPQLETLTIQVHGRSSCFSQDLLECLPKVPASLPKEKQSLAKSESKTCLTRLIPRALRFRTRKRASSPNIPRCTSIPECPSISVSTASALTHPLSHQLPFLKRIDWTEISNDSEAFYFFHELIRRTPNLRYLSIVEERSPTYLSTYPTVVLPSLTTLHIAQIRGLERIQAICQWSLPALTHVIVLPFPGNDDDVEHLSLLCRSFGCTLRSFELRSYMLDSLPIILPLCPNLQELNIRGLCSPGGPFPASHSSLSIIRLYSYAPPSRVKDDWDWWWATYNMGLHDTIAQLCALSLPALQRVVLHGDWTRILEDDRSRDSRHALHERGWRVELEDGTSVEPI